MYTGGVMQIHIPDNSQYRELGAYIKDAKHQKGPLIKVLHKAQSIFGYLPKEVQYFVARELNITESSVYGVVTFYNFFSTKPKGKNEINVCLGTACYVRGADKVLSMLEDELEISNGETTKDNIFSLNTARCFGACGLAPAVMINEEVYGHVDRKKIKKMLSEYRTKEE